VYRIGTEQSNATKSKATNKQSNNKQSKEKQSKATSSVGLSVSVLFSNHNNKRDSGGVHVSPHPPLLASHRSSSLLLSSPLLSLCIG
jgi:hypothetical protein